MLHKVSELCDKVDDLKILADRLRVAKYGTPKAPIEVIDEVIVQIQSQARLIGSDTNQYEKR
jgi:hypothetical protein